MAAMASRCHNIYYMPVLTERPDEDGDRRPNKRRRLSEEDDSGVQQVNLFSLPPSPPSSPWPQALSPAITAPTVVTPFSRPSSQASSSTGGKCGHCSIHLINLSCSACPHKFCGAACFDQHTRDTATEEILCPGIKSRIPFHDPVPALNMHFGFQEKKVIIVEEKMDEAVTLPESAVKSAEQPADQDKEENDSGWDETPSSSPSDVQKLMSPPVSPVPVARKRKDRMDDRVPLNLAHVFNECLIEGIKLRFQEMGRGRRLVNQTAIDMRTKKITWTVEFVFEDGPIFRKYLTHNVNDEKRIDEALKDLVCGPSFELPDSLSRFRSCGLADVNLFHVSCNGYSGVSPGMTIKEANLKNHSLLEFPTIVITPKDQKCITRYRIDED